MKQSSIVCIIFIAMTSMVLVLVLGMKSISFFLNDGDVSDTATWTLIGSFTGAIVSFFLLVSWDKYKDHKYSKKKDELILNSICHELGACFVNCHECLMHLEGELTHMNSAPGAGTYIMPPPILHLNIWELLKYHIPIYLKNNPEKVADLRSVSHRVAHFNAQLNSREEYHIHCKTLTTFKADLKIFDKALIDTLNDHMIPMIEPLRNEYSKFCIAAP